MYIRAYFVRVNPKFFINIPDPQAFHTSEATTKVTGPSPSEKVNMNMQSQNNTSVLDQSYWKAAPTMAKQMVTSTLLAKKRGRRPILAFLCQREEGSWWWW